MRPEVYKSKSAQAQEISSDQVALDFSFGCDWLKRWHESIKPIIGCGKGEGGGDVEANTNTDYFKQNNTVKRSSSQLKMVTPEPGTSKDVISLQTKV